MQTAFISDVMRLRHEMEYRNYSPRSVFNYCAALTVAERYFQSSLSAISQEEIKGFLRHRLVHDKVSVSTLNQTIGAFRLYFRDVLGRDWSEMKVKRPRREQKLPVVLSVEEVERLIGASTNIKHRCMMLVMYSSGLRRSELLQLKPNCIDSDRMVIRVKHGKGRKDRETLLSKKALELLRQYYKIYRPSVYLFEPAGRPGVIYSERSLENVVKNNSERAGILKKVSCHTFRHSFATHLLEQGVNIRLIQSFLGHTSLRTTSVYLHITNADTRNIQSPLDSMNL